MFSNCYLGFPNPLFIHKMNLSAYNPNPGGGGLAYIWYGYPDIGFGISIPLHFIPHYPLLSSPLPDPVIIYRKRGTFIEN